MRVNTENPLRHQKSQSELAVSDDLAARFLDALMTAIVDFQPTCVCALHVFFFKIGAGLKGFFCATSPLSVKTYDLHVEVVNTLLVLLSPVAFPRDHTKSPDDHGAHNPFLHLLMTNAQAGAAKSFWATGGVHRLLHNFMDQLNAPPSAKDTCSTRVAAAKNEDMSLIKISENLDASAEDDQFSYLTLEGIGSLACERQIDPCVGDTVCSLSRPDDDVATIFRFPLSFYRYFVTNEGHVSPLADRSVLLLLVLLQSYRSGFASNPFREALCSVIDEGAEDNKLEDSRTKVLEIPFKKLFSTIGR